MSQRIVLALAAVFTVLLAFDTATFHRAALARDLPLLFGADLILYALAYVLLLSGRLAAVAAASLPLAFVWTAGVLAIFNMPLDAPAFAAILAMEAAGAVLILYQLYEPIADICRGKPVVSAVHAAVGRMAGPFICGVLVMLAGIVVLASGEALVPVLAAGGACTAALAVASFALAPSFASRAEFGDARVARANRARELAEGFIARAAIVAKPRWAIAGLGIAAIAVAALVFAGERGMPVMSSRMVGLWQQGGPAFGFAFLVTAVVSTLFLRDWRGAFLTVFPAFLAATVATLVATASGLTPAGANAPLLVLGGCFGAVICVVVAHRFAAHRRNDATPDIAFQRSLNDCAMPILAAAAALSLASLLLAMIHPLGIAVALVIAIETALSLLLAAIFAGAVTELFPYRRSFGEMYGGKPRAKNS